MSFKFNIIKVFSIYLEAWMRIRIELALWLRIQIRTEISGYIRIRMNE
jgi:hypothetical protein